MKEFLHYLPLIAIGLFALIAALAFYLDWRRRNALADLAASMGLQFQKEGPDQAELESSGLEIFRHGHSRRASSLIEVPYINGRIRIFDYKYVTGSGKNSQTHNFTLALINCACQMPYFDLKPETFIYKIGEMIGFKDIDLPAFPVFSDKYRLTGPDETAVHLFFTPARAAWFERNLGLHVQGAPGHALFFRSERRLPADAWQGFMEEARVFAQEVLR